MAPRFYIDRTHLPVAEAATSSSFLIGSYTAKPSFGAYLELRANIDLHFLTNPNATLFVVLDDARVPIQPGLGARPGSVIPVYFAHGEQRRHFTGLTHPIRLPRIPPALLVHVYGGGFANDWWGGPVRLAIEALLEHHAADNPDGHRRVFVSGQQIAVPSDAQAWRPIFREAAYLGARDEESLAVFGALVGDGASGAPIDFSGDDALPAMVAILPPPTDAAIPLLAAHISLADHSTIAPERRLDRMTDALATAARRLDATDCDILVSSTPADPSEEEAAQRLQETYARKVSSGAAPMLAFRTRHILQEALAGALPLAPSFLLSCSYHVALAGLLSCCPTLLLVENDDYRQKAAALAANFNSFAALRAHESAITAVEFLLTRKRQASCEVAAAVYPVWNGQLRKASRLARLYAELENAGLRDRLSLVSAAFRDTAAQLGELRRRRILEDRLARDLTESAPMKIMTSSRAQMKYFNAAYWRKRRKSWARSLRKRLG